MQHLTEVEVDSMLDHARSVAASLSVAVNIAIMDNGANLLSFYRMDGAIIGSIDIALRKAKTAVYFPIPTDMLGKMVREEGLESLESSNGGLILFAGGEPLRRNGCLIGGIGVSGATAAQDQLIACAVVDLINGR